MFHSPVTFQRAPQVGKERFAAMLADMRERGSSDDELKELITKENMDRRGKIRL